MARPQKPIAESADVHALKAQPALARQRCQVLEAKAAAWEEACKRAYRMAVASPRPVEVTSV